MSNKSSTDAKYMHGHHASVLKSHSWRTASNSCAYLVPHLKPHMNILDIGCGPGTITCDLASIALEGKTIGLDPSESVLETARGFAKERNVKNVEFTTGDIYNLSYPDDTFDVVHAHQVLQHISDPVKALKEMQRVTKKGGLIASRETDVSSSIWWPMDPLMAEWRDCYMKTATASGGTPHAGRKLHVFAMEAGFTWDQMTISSDAYIYGGPVDRRFWFEMWADRLANSQTRRAMIDGGHASEEQVDRFVEMWTYLANDEHAQFTLVHGEILIRV